MKINELPESRKVSGVIYINERPLFPISWLQKQEFCEYQIYLENVAGIKVEPTRQMVIGKGEHENLYEEFKKEAVPATLDEMLLESKKARVLSRELSVRDSGHGIYGLIDEVLLAPDSFIVIDDKPGTKTFLSNINQVFGYCLAFKSSVVVQDSRPVIAALRERGTDNIYWSVPFDSQAEEHITTVIERVHSLLVGALEFNSSDNPNKCRACRFRERCDRLCS
ncbi:MAG: Dna2/Cas4 domain-containing protein [Dehalococcoidales bacterium]|nr:Dna2/Cas4 domain-containing protein [Dehalococcoidales bacterium]